MPHAFKKIKKLIEKLSLPTIIGGLIIFFGLFVFGSLLICGVGIGIVMDQIIKLNGVNKKWKKS